MFNKLFFAGSFFFKYWFEYIPNLNKREFFMLFILVLFTIILGILSSIIIHSFHKKFFVLVQLEVKHI